MNLLPKTHGEFSQVEYWDNFFKKRGKKSFEWYGEYTELCVILLKYVKIKDTILVVGCGNSTLSASLYDGGYRNIINIDISNVVIKQMREINKSKRSDLVFEQMDATEMTYPNEKFSVILDKGTLDALMPDTKEDTILRIDKYFQEITRVLRNGGRYICISLLQKHILHKLVSYFSIHNFMLRILRSYEAEAKARQEEGSCIPVFVVIATKCERLPAPILEIALNDEKPERVSSVDLLISAISSTQQAAVICDGLRKGSATDFEEISLDLHRIGEKHPRYTVYILDQPRPKGAKSYAAFIVPQGKETDWLFSTKEGRRQVLENAGKDRLAIVILRREHKFENLDKVKSELADSIRNLAPIGLPEKSEIPYLSLGSDIGERTICYEGTSKISGSFVIEETEEGCYTFRRLIFLDNPYVIQSEARLKEVKSRRGKTKKVVDHGFLACKHHEYMSIGVFIAVDSTESKEIVLVGLGGGGLCSFLYHCITNLTITAVEIDETIVKIATNYFGLQLDERMQVKIMDGIKFLETCSDKRYAAILFDVDSKDTTIGMNCPPKQFLELSLLKTVSNSLAKDGLFILNLVSRDSTLKQKVKEDLKSVFPFIACFALKEDINEILMCSTNKSDTKEWKSKVRKAIASLNEQASKKKLFTSEELFDVTALVLSMCIDQ